MTHTCQNTCQKEKKWNDAFKARDWILIQLKELKIITCDESKSKNDISSNADFNIF